MTTTILILIIISVIFLGVLGVYFYDKKLVKEIKAYEELIEYLKDPDIEQEYKVNTLKCSDNNGQKDQIIDWCRDKTIRGNGKFETYGKVKQEEQNHNYKVIKDKKHFS